MSKIKEKSPSRSKYKTYFYWFISTACLIAGVDAAMQVPGSGFTMCIFPYLAGGFLFLPPNLERWNIPLWLRWMLFLTLVGGFGALSAVLGIPFVPIQAAVQ